MRFFKNKLEKSIFAYSTLVSSSEGIEKKIEFMNTALTSFTGVESEKQELKAQMQQIVKLID